MDNEGRKLLEILSKNPARIAREMGFDKLEDGLHDRFIQTVMMPRRDSTTLAHRGSFKTTCVALGMAFGIIADPRRSTAFTRKTASDTTETMLQIVKILEHPIFAFLVKKIYGVDFIVEHATAGIITTNLYLTPRGTAQITGLGTGGSITGKHYDLIITDDIVNQNDRVSRAERERIKLIYQELQNIKNRGGYIINFGTPWHKEDAFSLMPEADKYDCYSTGLLDKLEIAGLRAKMSPSLFAANYELKHIASENALFDSEPRFIVAENPDILLYDGMVHIDAKYIGEDYSAITIGKKAADGTFYMYGDISPLHIDKVISRFLLHVDRFRGGPVNLEYNADKGYLAKDIRNLKHMAITYHESTNKFVKIASYGRRAWTKILWHPDTNPEYLSQILDFTEDADHDDAPDSMASLVRLIDPYLAGEFTVPARDVIEALDI